MYILGNVARQETHIQEIISRERGLQEMLEEGIYLLLFYGTGSSGLLCYFGGESEISVVPVVTAVHSCTCWIHLG